MFGSLHTYTSAAYPSLSDNKSERIAVSVLGTGDFGRALAARLAEAGADVRLGTRDINTVRCEVGPGVNIVTNKEAMREAIALVRKSRGRELHMLSDELKKPIDAYPKSLRDKVRKCKLDESRGIWHDRL